MSYLMAVYLLEVVILFAAVIGALIGVGNYREAHNVLNEFIDWARARHQSQNGRIIIARMIHRRSLCTVAIYFFFMVAGGFLVITTHEHIISWQPLVIRAATAGAVILLVIVDMLDIRDRRRTKAIVIAGKKGQYDETRTP